ncbi:MAG: type II toxin-antitoxin system Phd/YefM family antitoxin [Deltaproteobacteria bacterium]|nr:type II toxin-antitoxin system Phd/YefM family antitoxin [Deltaproteobacteria bacterium]
MASYPLGAARSNFTEIINKVTYGGERITITKYGKDAAAIVSLDDLNLLEAIETQIDIKEALEALKEPGSTPWEQVKKDLNL